MERELAAMNVVHLLASPFVGGPERQVLGLARSLPPSYRSVFLSFPEHGRGYAVLEQARRDGFEAHALQHNTPRVGRAAREVTGWLRRLKADVVLCNGYKPDIIGWYAARRAGVPALSISHGWTAATWKVRAYEILDRLVLRWMDRVVCVSAAQAERVRQAWVPPDKVVVIRNAIGPEAFAPADAEYRRKLQAFFPRPPRLVVGSAGRLSPEKGFGLFVQAARELAPRWPDVGFIHFGEGPLRGEMVQAIFIAGLEQRFILAGFHKDVGRYLPHLDLCVLPSFTEGLPVVLLEAFAAGVPAVATAVGGTPEVVDDGVNGLLVPPGAVAALREAIEEMLRDEPRRRAMGEHGQKKVREKFTFAALSQAYQKLLREVVR